MEYQRDQSQSATRFLDRQSRLLLLAILPVLLGPRNSGFR
jgi:hypothetical protein